MASKSSMQPREKLDPTPSAVSVSQLPEQPRRPWGKLAGKSGAVAGKDIFLINWHLALQAAMRAQHGPMGVESSFGPQEEDEVKYD